MKATTRNKRIMRHRRVRGKISGIAVKPRLSVFRSSKHLFMQLIDDESGKTIVGLGDYEKKGVKKKLVGTKTERAKKLGQELAKMALEKNIKKVVFDRGGFAYHGRIKAAADGAREGGLVF